MTQINLANLITQMQPASSDQKVRNDAGQSTEHPNNAEKKNLTSISDTQEPDRNENFDNNTSKNNKDNRENKSNTKSKPDQSGEVSASTGAVGQESIDSREQAPKINFEEIVAKISLDSNLGTDQPVGKSEVNLEIIPADTQPKIVPTGLVADNNEFGEVIRAGVNESPAEGTNNSIIDEAVENNAVGKFPPPQPTAPLEISSTVLKADSQQVVSPVLPEMKLDAAKNQVEVGEIKPEGFQAETNLTVTEIPLETKELEITANPNESLKTDIDSVRISPQIQKTEVNSPSSDLRKLAGSAAETMSNQTKTQIDSTPAESSTKLSEKQSESLDLEVNTAQINRIRISNIASYREVQESVPSDSLLAAVSMVKAEPTVLLEGNAKVGKGEKSVGNAVAKISTGTAQTRARANSRANRNSTIDDISAVEIAIAETSVETAVENPNWAQVTEVFYPGESAPPTAVSGVSSVGEAGISREVSTEMIDQITNYIQANRNNLGEQMTVSLNPPELGNIKIQIISDGSEGLRGVIQVEHARTLTELNREVPVLIQKLNDAGIQVKNMEFRMNDQNESRGDSSQSNSSSAFDFNANRQSRGGGEAHGETENSSDNHAHQGLEYQNITREVDDTYISGGHYVSENSLNVMV